jgi:hypothetical protein
MHAAPLPPRYLSRKKEKKKRVLIKFILWIFYINFALLI